MGEFDLVVNILGYWKFFIFIIAVLVAVFYFYKSKKGSSSTISTKNLEMFAVDLTAQAKLGKIDPVVGRQEEIDRATQILTRRTKNNVILVGAPGVGKTAVVEGLAGRIATGDVPEVLLNKRVLLLQVAELLAGTKYRGEFEQRIKGIVQEIKNSNRTIILFIDEIHTITETKGTEGAVNLSDILKPALARGDLQLIGATTQKEYEQYIQPDESWDRRFQVVLVDEPSAEESVNILQGIKKNYEDYHKVKISDEAISAAVRLSQEYIKNRRLPDKAIDIMDEASAMVNVEKGSRHHSAAALLHLASKKACENCQEEYPVVDVDHVKDVVADWVGMKKEEIH
ncbi:MAG: Negative regulator of genetic competence ClpC/mecB [Candidatus Magasanikbacteria bacterium GW2011_GWC2_37_14]|uniref:Negative regulator of genetic competence ClpC/mecB n=1 Tax=Candidatus Magasanikbacteria bacterium GW2011_GWC2_37_14 TaxID=1619046 RepID=A0A0G0GA17_9BACT|nr:MAG: Negative regulator of genetic competence ClpC/mecB [Candidatus Magasanikbacteria bacterium GW2011_GWC2_37_14]